MDRPRVIVTGSRRHRDRDLIWDTLDEVYRQVGPLIIVHGAANGADAMAAWWVHRRLADGWQVDQERHPADWAGPCRPGCAEPWPAGHNGRRAPYKRAAGTYCQLAGIYRNHEMGDLPGVIGYVAFPLPGGTGTLDMIAYAGSKGIRDLAVRA